MARAHGVPTLPQARPSLRPCGAVDTSRHRYWQLHPITPALRPARHSAELIATGGLERRLGGLGVVDATPIVGAPPRPANGRGTGTEEYWPGGLTQGQVDRPIGM